MCKAQAGVLMPGLEPERHIGPNVPPMSKRPSAKIKPRKVGSPAPRPLQYKVVELSTVDQSAIEEAVNGWVSQGWNLDGVQFAMRESSKRPAMAFVFFTRAGAAAPPEESAARLKLRRLAEAAQAIPAPVSARARLAQLAGLEQDPSEGE